MVTRRQFLLAGAAVAAGTVVFESCLSKSSGVSYEEAVRRTWHLTGGATSDHPARLRELVRCATLAPSSHNTQCWKFAIQEHSIAIAPDLSRRCPAVDPDDHHLYVSLGCASENLIQAALANGLKGNATFDEAARGAVSIALEPTTPVASPLYHAILRRQSTRAAFDGRPVSDNELKQLEQAGRGTGVHLLLLTDKPKMEGVLEHVIEGNTTQMKDRAFVDELKRWVRFSDEEAVRTGDGLFSRSSGTPSIPRWVGSPLFPFLFTPKNENDKYARHVRSSSGIAVFVSETNDQAHWVEAGRCYERFALQAAALGIRNALLNQPIEVAALRPQFASFLGVGNQRPDMVLRFGRGPEMPRSLRRPVEAVLA